MDNELKEMIKEWITFISNRYKKDKEILSNESQDYCIALAKQDFEGIDKNYNKTLAIFKFESELEKLYNSLIELRMYS